MRDIRSPSSAECEASPAVATAARHTTKVYNPTCRAKGASRDASKTVGMLAYQCCFGNWQLPYLAVFVTTFVAPLAGLFLLASFGLVSAGRIDSACRLSGRKRSAEVFYAASEWGLLEGMCDEFRRHRSCCKRLALIGRGRYHRCHRGTPHWHPQDNADRSNKRPDLIDFGRSPGK